MIPNAATDETRLKMLLQMSEMVDIAGITEISEMPDISVRGELEFRLFRTSSGKETEGQNNRLVFSLLWSDKRRTEGQNDCLFFSFVSAGYDNCLEGQNICLQSLASGGQNNCLPELP